MPAQFGIQISRRNTKTNCKLSKTNVLARLQKSHWKKINWHPVSEWFNQYLFSNAFKFLKETCPLYFEDNIYAILSNSSQYEICSETKTSFKKHVFWSKNFLLSNTNSVEQFADGAEVAKFT